MLRNFLKGVCRKLCELHFFHQSLTSGPLKNRFLKNIIELGSIFLRNCSNLEDTPQKAHDTVDKNFQKLRQEWHRGVRLRNVHDRKIKLKWNSALRFTSRSQNWQLCMSYWPILTVRCHPNCSQNLWILFSNIWTNSKTNPNCNSLFIRGSRCSNNETRTPFKQTF